MDRYEVKAPLGDGTYGCVLRGIKKCSGEVVAIKKMKKRYGSWKECMDLREVRTLRDLNHPNIVLLHEVIREDDSTLCFVFEHMEANLYEVMKHYQNLFNMQGRPGQVTLNTVIPEAKIRSILYQVLEALSFMHHRGYFHRDIKPENLLVKNDVVKVADLGLAREVRSCPPYTDYVSTRWYRAPEVLLRSPNYNSPIDMFALGCILAELYSLQPLFPGSSEIDQIDRICAILGAPTVETWPEGAHLARKMNLNLPYAALASRSCVHPSQKYSVNHEALQRMVPQLSNRPEAIDLLKSMLVLNPVGRLNAKAALDHPFFRLDLRRVNIENDNLATQATQRNTSGKAPSRGFVSNQDRQSFPTHSSSQVSAMTLSADRLNASLSGFRTNDSKNLPAGGTITHTSLFNAGESHIGAAEHKPTSNLNSSTANACDQGSFNHSLSPFGMQHHAASACAIPVSTGMYTSGDASGARVSPNEVGTLSTGDGMSREEKSNHNGDTKFLPDPTKAFVSRRAASAGPASSGHYPCPQFGDSLAKTCAGLSRISTAGMSVMDVGSFGTSAFVSSRAVSSGIIRRSGTGNTGALETSGFGRHKF